MLTSEPDSAKMMENLRNWVRVLVHADNMELLKGDSALGTAYNKGLCKALLAAAVHGRSEAIPELMGVLRCATDHDAACQKESAALLTSPLTWFWLALLHAA